MRSIAFDQVGRDNEVFASFDLHISQDRCDLLAQGSPIATMNRQSHFALTSLSSAASLEYTGIIHQTQSRKIPVATTKALPATSSKLTCAMALLIYGPQSISDSLAKELSRFRLFLQHPTPIASHIVYKNPQYLSMAQSSFANGAILPPITNEIIEPNNDQTVELDCNEFTDLLDVVDHLPRHQQLREADVDQRIKTPLLRYSKLHSSIK